jgi:hypothetical protein
MTLSLPTLRILSEILNTAQVNVGGEEFEENAPKLATAKRELRRELALREKVEPKKPKRSSTRKRR